MLKTRMNVWLCVFVCKWSIEMCAYLKALHGQVFSVHIRPYPRFFCSSPLLSLDIRVHVLDVHIHAAYLVQLVCKCVCAISKLYHLFLLKSSCECVLNCLCFHLCKTKNIPIKKNKNDSLLYRKQKYTIFTKMTKLKMKHKILCRNWYWLNKVRILKIN